MAVREKLTAALQRRPTRITAEEYLQKLMAKGLKPDGTQDVDPRPLAPPIGYKKHPSMVELVRDMVRSERVRIAAEEAGMESFEEADDFDVGDEPEMMRSPWENQFDPPIVELVEEGRKIVVEREGQEAARTAADKSGGSGGRPPEEGADPAP